MAPANEPASPTSTTSTSTTAALTLAGRVRRAASAVKRSVVCLGKRRAPQAKSAATFDIVALQPGPVVVPNAHASSMNVAPPLPMDVAPAVLVAPPHKIRRKPVPVYDALAHAAPRVPPSLDEPKPTPSRTLEVPPAVHRIRRKPVPAYDATPVARPAKPPLPPRDVRRKLALALEDVVPRIVVICDEGTVVADSASDVDGPPSPMSDDSGIGMSDYEMSEDEDAGAACSPRVDSHELLLSEVGIWRGPPVFGHPMKRTQRLVRQPREWTRIVSSAVS